MPDTCAEKHLSFWLGTALSTNYPPIPGDRSMGLRIRGIMDLTAVILRKRLGKRVSVVEARRIAESVMGHMPAKVASQHELIYVPSFVYTESEDYLGQLGAEVEGRVGLPSCGTCRFPSWEGGGPVQWSGTVVRAQVLLPLAEEMLGNDRDDRWPGHDERGCQR
jgi:hypothetical protein